MKILQINKFYYKKGGSESHFIDLVNLLRKDHHEVIVFSTRHKDNFPLAKKDVLVDELSMRLTNFFRGFNLFYNRKVIVALKNLIKKERPDLVHVHNFNHHFSPAILKLFKKYNLPVVMTVHDYKLICPNYKLFNKNKICEKCIGGKYFECAHNKCVKDSYLASLVMALEAYWSKWKKYYQNIDIFIAPSHFMQTKLIQGGYPTAKIKYLPNFLQQPEMATVKEKKSAERYILFFGRLSAEKGLAELIQTFGEIENKRIELKIAGEGPQKNQLEKIIAETNLASRVKLLGYQNSLDLIELIAGAELVVVPSRWYENAPYVILEAYAQRKPVLGADIGGITEMIKNDETGWLYNPQKREDFKKQMNEILKDSPKLKEAGQRGNIWLKEAFGEENYRKKLLKIYEVALAKK